ncbi:hypothetical protein HC031_07055 [Planosporangium thailandense]|uniref:DUF3618 domain-containing protein n=1 Tax=Planosporangium thailandense TaxID=765197 RepID=A0ABX0XU02_9ACTN|nr:hypothetical protein [Planosporangium thailandense]NJC69478.1 hypothetical protein [Planosporangium thailandense]
MDDAQTGARAPASTSPVRQTVGEATDAATQAAGNVTDTAADQARQVAGEVSDQARGVAAELRDQVGGQVRTQNDRLVDGIRRMADELDGMVGDGDSSPARTVVSRVAQGSRQMADYLADRGPEGVLDEVQDFARRRPGAFLATALVSGFVIGRLGKGVFGATTETSTTRTTPTTPMPHRDTMVPDIPRMRSEPAYPTAGYPTSAVEPGHPNGTGTAGPTGVGTASTPMVASETDYPPPASESGATTEYRSTGTGRPMPMPESVGASTSFERGVASGSTGAQRDDATLDGMS